MGTVLNIWQRSRLERARDELNTAFINTVRFPVSARRGIHPDHLKIGEIVHRVATQEMKRDEVPAELHGCPWIFVITELQKQFPEDGWNAKPLLRYVELFLSHTQREGARTAELPLIDEWSKRNA